MSRSGPGAATGKGSSITSCSSRASRQWPVPECVAEAEAKLGGSSSRRHPSQHLINPNDDWWHQWFSDNGVPVDDGVFRRPGVRLDSQADEGHAAMAGQGFAVLTPLLWKGDVAAGG